MIIGILINSIILMAIIMYIGFYLRNKGVLNDEGEGVLIYLLVNITTPAMVINAMNIDFSIEQLKTGAVLLLISSVFIILLILLENILLPKTKDIEKEKIEKYTAVLLNGGFMGFPLAYQIYGSEGLFYATMFHVPNLLFMWTYGTSVLLGKKKIKNRYKLLLINPGMIGVYIGLILYFSQLKLPLFLTNLLDLLTNATTFLSMIIIGSKIAIIGIKDSFIDKETYPSTFFRLVVSPLLMIIIMKLLKIGGMVGQIYVMYAALPVAALVPILAQKYGGDVVFASKAVVINHLLSLFTIPFFVWLFNVL
ncbi:MAG TPA: hypothetical protein GX396_01820 [Tissierellia bacterium]|jgi:predicted permease|nr:hypothetical protein [Tissierellia bacterium]